MMKIKLILLVIFFSLSTYTYSQTDRGVDYTYDKAGNQIKREKHYVIIVWPDAKPYSKKTGITEKEFRIYPNPTKGDLVVDIYPFDAKEDICKVIVVDYEGKQIIGTEFHTERNYLDLTDQPDGYYILTLQINGKLHSWKIIKE